VVKAYGQEWQLGRIVVGRDGPRGSCGTEALYRQIFIVGYLKFLEAVPAVHTGYGALPLVRTWPRRLPKSGIAVQLKSGSFIETMRKLPSRWQPFTD